MRQPAQAARLARTLNNAAQELWDACTHTDTDKMWDEAQAIARRILAAAPSASRTPKQQGPAIAGLFFELRASGAGASENVLHPSTKGIAWEKPHSSRFRSVGNIDRVITDE